MQRIQRTRNSKLPKGTCCATRPNKLGNPFIVKDNIIYFQVRGDKDLIKTTYTTKDKTKEEIYTLLAILHFEWLRGLSNFCSCQTPPSIEEIQEAFEGKDYVACWCNLSLPCHTDNLILLYEESNRLERKANTLLNEVVEIIVRSGDICAIVKRDGKYSLFLNYNEEPKGVFDWTQNFSDFIQIGGSLAVEGTPKEMLEKSIIVAKEESSRRANFFNMHKKEIIEMFETYTKLNINHE